MKKNLWKGRNKLFLVYKNSTEILNKLKAKGFQASTISTYDFSTLCTTLPHNLIRNQLVHLIENTFRREEALYLACNEERAFFASEEHKKYDLWSCQKVTDALIFLLDNIFIRFDSKLNRQNVGIPMGTNCAPFVADLFLFCYERDFMKSLTKEKRYDLIDAFNSTSRYLDDLLNIDNIHFELLVHRIYPAELQLNKANASDTEAAFLDLNLSIYNDTVSTKYMINGMILILILLISRSLMAMSLNVPLMVYIYLNLFDFPEHLRMLLTSIVVTNS